MRSVDDLKSLLIQIKENKFSLSKDFDIDGLIVNMMKFIVSNPI